jgi:WD40 repeat protein
MSKRKSGPLAASPARIGSPFDERAERVLSPHLNDAHADADDALYRESRRTKRRRVSMEDDSCLHAFSTLNDKPHLHPVNSIDLSPDGGTLISGSVDKTVKVWDLASEQCTATLKGHAEYVASVCFAPDGRTMMTGSFDKTACIWDPRDSASAPVRRIAHSEPVHSVAYSALGDTVAFADGSVYSTAAGASAGRVSHFPGCAGKVCAYSMDHAWFVHDNYHLSELRVTSTASDLNLPKPVGRHANDITGVAFAPDDSMCASSSLDGTVRLWEPQTASHIATLSAHGDSVMCVAFSPDGALLATGGRDERILVYSVSEDSLELRQVLMGHRDAVSSLAFSPDSRSLYSGAWDNSLKLWHCYEEGRSV